MLFFCAQLFYYLREIGEIIHVYSPMYKLQFHVFYFSICYQLHAILSVKMNMAHNQQFYCFDSSANEMPNVFVVNNMDKVARTKSHEMKFSNGGRFVIDSCASEVDHLKLNKTFSVDIISDSSSPTTAELPVSHSSIVSFLQKFINNSWFRVFQWKLP